MMTTPGPETNYFHYLATCRDKEGNPQLYLSRYANICADCQKTANPMLCTHISDAVSWIDRAEQDEMAFLYGGNERYRAQEQYALVSASHNFPWAHYVPAMLELPSPNETFRLNCPIVLSVDTAYGGKNRSAIYGSYFEDWHQNKDPERMVVSGWRERERSDSLLPFDVEYRILGTAAFFASSGGW